MGKKINSSLLVGRKPIIDAIEAHERLEKIWIDRGLSGSIEIAVRNYCKEYAVPMSVVDSRKLDQLSKTNHQGLIAQVALIQYYAIHDVVQLAYDKGELPFLLFLDGVTDVRNMGAIARSAEIFGAHGIVTTLKNSAIINDLAMKTSAGALTHIPMCRVKSIISGMEEIHNMGLITYAADMNGQKSIEEISAQQPLAIFLGDEGNGVSQGVIDRVHHTFFIPQVGKTESLNVSVAAAICSYTVMIQRR